MASDALDIWGALWVQMLSDILLPTATDLARHSLNRTRGYPEADHSLCLAIKFLTKAILQYLPSLKAEPDFPDLWGRLLQILQVCFCLIALLSSALHLLDWDTKMIAARRFQLLGCNTAAFVSEKMSPADSRHCFHGKHHGKMIRRELHCLG